MTGMRVMKGLTKSSAAAISPCTSVPVRMFRRSKAAARTSVGELPAPAHDWPWGSEYWKPSEDPVRNLVKAGALIAAEIDRLNRAKAKGGAS